MARGGVKLSILSSYDKKGTDQAEKALEKFAKAYGQVDQATKSITLDDTTASLARQSIAADQLAGKWDKVGSKAQDVGGKLTAGLTVPIGAAAAASVNTAIQYESAGSRIEAALGGSYEEAERFTAIGQSIYENGWGQSLDEVTTALLQTKQTIRDIDDEGLETVTTNALMLSQVFGADVNESIRGINALMEGFGLSATEATDLMTVGMQRGLNYTDELGDNLSEYSVRWGEAGMSASTYFSLLEAGASNGAYNLDKVGDFLNEFLTSLSDGRMESSMASFSEGTQEVFESFQNGGATAEDVLNSVLTDLNNMLNGYEKAQIASELWSSLGEDNAMGMITALGGVENSFGDVEGAADKAAEAATDNLGNKAQEALRKLQGAIEPLAEPLLRVADGAIEAANDFSEWFSELDEGSQNAVIALALVAASVGPVTTGFGKMASAGSSVLQLYADITARMAQNSAAAASGAATTSRLGTAFQTAGTKMRGFVTAQNLARAGAVGLGAAFVVLAGTQIAEYIREQEEMNQATEGLRNAQLDAIASSQAVGTALGELENAYAGANTEAENAASSSYGVNDAYAQQARSLASTSSAIDQLVTSQANMAASIQESFSSMYASNAQLDVYRDTINSLANQSGLTAQEQAQLQVAIDGLNSACGTSYSVIDAANGVIADQAGVAMDTTDAINDLIDAKQREAQANALNDAYTQSLKPQQDAYTQLGEALKIQAEKQKAYDEEVANGGLNAAEYANQLKAANDEVARVQGLCDSASAGVSGYNGQLTLLAMAEQQGANSNAAWLSSYSQIGAIMTSNGQDVSLFAQQLDSAGISAEDFAGSLEASGITIEEMATAYDGSLTSIARLCQDKGVEIPQSLRDGILNGSSDIANAVGATKEAMVLELTGGDVELAAELLGQDISEGLKNGIEGTADMPQEAIGIMSDETIAKAKDQFESHSPSQVMYRLGSDINQGLANGISENSYGPLGAVQTLGQLLLGGFSGFATGGYTAGFNLVSTFASSIGVNSPLGTAAAGSMAFGAVGAASANSNAYGAGATLSSTMAGGISALAGIVSSNARGVASSGTSAALGSSDASSAGRNLSSSFATSINDFAAQANARSMANRSASAARQASDASSAGRNLSSSFAMGIDLSAAVDRAAQMARNALQAAKNALGIASPSKEFTALGEYSAQGFARGFDNDAGLAVKASRTMASDALSAANGVFDSASYGAAAYSSNSSEVLTVLINQQNTLVDLLYEVRTLRTTLGQVIRGAVGNQGGLRFANDNEAARWVQKMERMNV